MELLDRDREFDLSKQRVLKRNWRFSLVPALILLLLFLILGWEVLRQNMPVEWPWTLALLGVAPAATLCGVFGGLLFAREQYARSVRPHLSWQVRLRQSDTLSAKAWTTLLMNVGPGIAHVEAVGYSVRLITADGELARDTVSHAVALEVFKSVGLQEGKDFELRLLTPGAPLPVVTKRDDALEFAALTEPAIRKIKRLDFHIIVVDTVGDRHAKSLPFRAALPDWTKTVEDAAPTKSKEPDNAQA
jgi:hypothetical protein